MVGRAPSRSPPPRRPESGRTPAPRGESAGVRNRSLHDALRDFALEAAALLTADVEAGAELAFHVEETGGRRAVLYNYRPLTAEFIAERWHRLRLLAAMAPAARALGSGAGAYLRVQGAPGADAEPALRAMLERLYEDASSFDFPEERFERVYGEVEATLYEHAIRVSIVAPLRGIRIESDRVELGEGLALVSGDWTDAPPEAVWGAEAAGGSEPNVLCVIEEDADAATGVPIAGAAERYTALRTALRLWSPGSIGLGPLAWARADGGPWRHFSLPGPAGTRGEGWTLAREEEGDLREFIAAIWRARPAGNVRWALARFEMSCERAGAAEALSDHLLALSALLEGREAPGRANLPLRVAVLCAEEGSRRAVQRRVELAFTVERFLMAGGGEAAYVDSFGPESPAVLADEMEGHLRALLRDVLCGYLDPDLRSVADDLLLAAGEAFEADAGTTIREGACAPAAGPGPAPEQPIRVWRGEHAPPPHPVAVAGEADRRAAPDEGELEPVTSDFEAVRGVTPSDDWACDEDPENWSAPV